MELYVNRARGTPRGLGGLRGPKALLKNLEGIF